MKNTMKKMAAMIAVIALVLTAFTAFANDGSEMNVAVYDRCETRMITVSGANVRTMPSTEGRILKTFSYGTTFEVTGLTSNGWYRIWTTDPVYGGMTYGYIAGNLTSAASGTITNNNNQAGITFTNSSHSLNLHHADNVFRANVKVNFLALRSTPYSCDENIIGKIWNGQTVNVINYGSQFDYVYVPALNMYGYVNNDYLE